MTKVADLFSRALTGHLQEPLFGRLRAARVLVAGLGGGSNVAELLARKGIGMLRIVDPDVFEPSNVRQRQALKSTWGRPKALAVAERLSDINPEIKLETVEGAISRENVERMVDEVDVVVDMLDFSALPEKVALHAAAHQARKYSMTAPSLVNGALSIVFHPDGPSFGEWLAGPARSIAQITPDLVIERLGFRVPEEAPLEMYVDAAHGKRTFPLDAVGVDQAAVLVASNVENLLLGRSHRVVFAPKCLVVDVSDARFIGRVFE